MFVEKEDVEEEREERGGEVHEERGEREGKGVPTLSTTCREMAKISMAMISLKRTDFDPR
tara:strand:- start:73 stop:252 length:180 start_codon:yes stop_codon:yes gene_type:complete